MRVCTFEILFAQERVAYTNSLQPNRANATRTGSGLEWSGFGAFKV